MDAQLSNKPVSIQLEDGEETTVPSNEKWVVTIVLASNTSSYARMQINGTRSFGRMSDGQHSPGEKPSEEMAFTGGDTIRANNYNGSVVYIQGFVISE